MIKWLNINILFGLIISKLSYKAMWGLRHHWATAFVNWATSSMPGFKPRCRPFKAQIESISNKLVIWNKLNQVNKKKHSSNWSWTFKQEVTWVNVSHIQLFQKPKARTNNLNMEVHTKRYPFYTPEHLYFRFWSIECIMTL